VGYSEYNQRELLLRWADHLERPARAAAQLHVGVDPVSAAPAACADTAAAVPAMMSQEA
jgi:hypothetical protein